MFSVIFEVQPRPEQWEAYLGTAKVLRPELERVEGFIDNVRYKSLTRKNWVLSLSGWRDEKSLVRWRTQMRHHMAQEAGRSQIMLDYHLRVGQITRDTRTPAGYALTEQRFDETEAGEGTTVTLVDARGPEQPTESLSAVDCFTHLGHDPHAEGLVHSDVFDAILTPGDVIMLLTWRAREHAETYEKTLTLPRGGRLRRVRIVRDYGMFDRREAPQYYPEVARN
jgi:heme-degrading monooxygenase HmoA